MASVEPMQVAIIKIQKLEAEVENLKKDVQAKTKMAAKLEQNIEELKLKNTALEDENNQHMEELAHITAVYKQKELLRGVWKELLAEKQATLASEQLSLKRKQTEVLEARIKFCDKVNSITSKTDSDNQGCGKN